MLFLSALHDDALQPAMSRNMGSNITRLTRKEVNASHWALWEEPEEVNKIIYNWLKGYGIGQPRSIL